MIRSHEWPVVCRPRSRACPRATREKAMDHKEVAVKYQAKKSRNLRRQMENDKTKVKRTRSCEDLEPAMMS